MRATSSNATAPLFFCFLLLTALLGGCSSMERFRHPPESTPSHALADPENTELGRLFASAASAHPGKSGLRLLDLGEESLIWRGVLVDRAQKTIDIQTFIWSSDNVGTIAAERVLRAADRGVRVRVLVDDFMLTVRQEYLVWLDAHPNVEIRIYNPLADPGASMLAKLSGLLGNWSLKQRRMHNKLFVVDNSVAIMGGRNIADEYYDMNPEYNFRDRDLLVAGRAVPELSTGFDRFWNSAWAFPVAAMAQQTPSDQERLGYYQVLKDYAEDPNNFPPRFNDAMAHLEERLAALPKQLIWADARVLVDVPGKNRDLDTLTGYGQTGKALTEAAAKAQREIIVQTPYLVPMPGTLELIQAQRERGVRFRVLTNSFASTDNFPAFAGYLRARPGLLKSGVQLYELRPDPAIEPELIERHPLMQEDATVSLHAKTAVFDRRQVFVGSFNLDPRSTHLNTELGMLVDSEELAGQIAEAIEKDMRPENCWQVSLDPDGEPVWRSRRDGVDVETHYEPDTGIGDLFKMLPIALIPMESIL